MFQNYFENSLIFIINATPKKNRKEFARKFPESFNFTNYNISQVLRYLFPPLARFLQRKSASLWRARTVPICPQSSRSGHWLKIVIRHQGSPMQAPNQASYTVTSISHKGVGMSVPLRRVKRY